MLNWRSYPIADLSGDITIASDKSISHRAIILGALAEGITHINGFLEGEDCLATLRAFQQMGVEIKHDGNGKVAIHGKGLYGLKAPKGALDLGNSGTSMRLMSGVLAGQPFASELVGDESLMKRPMCRVTKPLIEMGAQITTTAQGTAPIRIQGKQPLRAIHYLMPFASAQLKSCLLLAGLYAQGTTTITECGLSRDHSERMLKGFGVEVKRVNNTLSIQGAQRLKAVDIEVPGDISSAAFFIVAALIAKNADLTIRHVGINPTRSAVIDVLQAMGGDISLFNEGEVGGEPVADLRMRSSRLKGIEIPPEYIPIIIDELPIIFIAAAYAHGKTSAREISELRVKESDRLAAMAEGLTNLGIVCESGNDFLIIEGGSLQGGRVSSYTDHRIAMSFTVAAIGAQAPIIIEDCANVATSFPTFQTLARQLNMRVEDEPE